MYYSRPPYIIYRDFPDYGYLTDNRNYGYDTASRSCKKVGDMILSKTGSVFYSILSENPQSIYEISQKLLEKFKGVALEKIQEDSFDFFYKLSEEGFVLKNRFINNQINRDWFSYDNCTPYEIEKSYYDPEINTGNTNQSTENRLSRVHLNISDTCNEKCVHCYIPKYLKPNKMSKALFHKILRECKEMNVLNITLGGGEPMLNDNLLFFITKCKENNFSINLLTNLTLLSDSMVDEFCNIPLLSVQTTIYSLKDRIHDSITGVKGSLKKTIEGIKKLRNYNIPMQINCPVMKQNLNFYREVLDWGKSLNIETDSDYMIFGCYDGSKKNLINRLDLSEVKCLLRYDKQENKNFIVENRKSSSNIVCPICQTSLCISSTGNVYPCEGLQSISLGNLNTTTINKIWHSSNLIKELRNLTIKDFPKCKVCEDRDYCSTCLVRNVTESPSLSFRDVNSYFCSIAKMKNDIMKE